MENKKILVGMSGGVDSSVTAYLLKSQGYEVIGAVMVNDITSRVQEEAATVCEYLGIPLYVIDTTKVFAERVINYFVNEYINGRTPNPCVICNRLVKWAMLLEKADELGIGDFATGHYAEICRYPETGRFTVKNSAAGSKDQTYMLFNLKQEQLERTQMPLFGFTKDGVRKIAREAGIPTADKPDSQEICFIPDNDYVSFIKKNITDDSLCGKGRFIDSEGNELGRHDGIIHFTVGQRKGLGIAFGKQVFVQEINPDGDIVLGTGEDLYTDKMNVENINFMAISGYDSLVTDTIWVKIRHSHKPAECSVVYSGDKLSVRFKEKQRAVTPGQAAVFYKDGYLLFGGFIKP